MTHQTKDVLASSPSMPAVARELAKEVLLEHRLEPGDEILIEPVEIDSELQLPADQVIAADGTIDLGKFGRVVVASFTLEQAEELVRRAIPVEQEKDNAVNVRLIQPSHRFYVIGEVNSPGAYPLVGNETVLDGLMAAGGLTTRASACDMLLARPTNPCSCRVTLPVCYRAITQLGDTTTNYQLRPGDRIFVGRQTLIEEVLPCCSQRTCERCCGVHRACRDPRVAELQGASFEEPMITLIAPHSPGMQTDAEPSSTAAEAGGQPDDTELLGPKTQDAFSKEVPSEPTLPEPILDGELDFGDFLKGESRR